MNNLSKQNLRLGGMMNKDNKIRIIFFTVTAVFLFSSICFGSDNFLYHIECINTKNGNLLCHECPESSKEQNDSPDGSLPTLFIYSEPDPDVSNDEWVALNDCGSQCMYDFMLDIFCSDSEYSKELRDKYKMTSGKNCEVFDE